jgi:hypothetical protein
MKQYLILSLALACGLASAETPHQILDSYAAAAARAQPGFTAQAARGSDFYAHRYAVSEKMPACTACHTDRPAGTGQHVVTRKDIKPLAPAANTERFTDPAKVEKWFRRNCQEVVGRECSAAEKADFIAFLTEGR